LLILYLTIILKINYIFIIDLNLIFLKIKKCEQTTTMTMYSLVYI